jgi:hypothetical protein
MMTIGTQAEIATRIFRWLPARWFPTGCGQGTLIFAIVSGLAAGFSMIYTTIAYAGLQVRIATATDGWLDLIAGDYFGNTLMRNAGEPDAAFSNRLRREILREKVTREALDRVIFDTTGNHPVLIEANRVSDVGAWRQGFAWRTGSYGSAGLPFQIFVTSPRQNPVPFPILGGWRVLPAAYRGTGLAYSLPSIMPPAQPPDAAIIAAIERVRPAGITVWLQLTNQPVSTLSG